MFKKINKIKSILSKLYLANKSFKKIIYIKRTDLTLVILENLQKRGVIYGYLKKNYDTFMVFLKYYGLESLYFINKIITKNNLFTFEKNSLYFSSFSPKNTTKESEYFLNCSISSIVFISEP